LTARGGLLLLLLLQRLLLLLLLLLRRRQSGRQVEARRWTNELRGNRFLIIAN
jgi:hypothetical protein